MKPFLLFDFDGTVADTGRAVMTSTYKTLAARGFSEAQMGDLRRMIGPPLWKSFHDFYGFSREESLVVADEAHHAISSSWRAVLDYFVGARVLGVTATPDRGDKRNLGTFFENIAYEVSLFDLIRQNYLSPIACKAIPVQIDLTGVRKIAGDYSDADLGDAGHP